MSLPDFWRKPRKTRRRMKRKAKKRRIRRTSKVHFDCPVFSRF